MNNKNAEKKIKEVLFKQINKQKFKVFLFGSRAKGDYKKNSDYDIGILGKEKLDYKKYLNLKIALDELPYLIDVVDFNDTSKDFKKIALKYTKKWN